MKKPHIRLSLCCLLAAVFFRHPLLAQEGSVEQQVAAHMYAGEYAEAAEKLETLIKSAEQRVDYHFRLADARFMNVQMKQAIAAYDRAIELDPSLAPRVWQRGLALYFADEFEKGKTQFETHQTVNRQDVENSVWHLLCHAKIAGVDKARKEMIPISGDQRVPMPEVLELFAGTGSIDQVLKAATESAADEPMRNAYLYYAHIYIGLYQEMMGEPEKAAESMKKASEINPISKAQLMGSVADVFLKLRDPDNRN